MLLVVSQLLGLRRAGLPLPGHAETTLRTAPAELPLSRFSPPHCSASDDERLLLTEPALNAFIVAEMRHFCTNAMNKLDYSGSLADRRRRENEMPGEQAVEALCDMTRSSFRRLFNTGLGSKSMDGTDHTGLSNLGSAISFFRDTFEGSRALELPLERVGLSGYQVAHHITDMYHHRTFRGTYTKTLQPSGLGEIAAREAVGLSVAADEEEEEEEDDACLLWSPTGSGACLQWASEQDAYTGRSRRFEKVQMEGTRDPRRGGSGTTR